MSITMSLTTSPTNDPDLRAWHSRYELISGQSAEAALRYTATEENSQLLRDILDIPGVESVQIRPYILLVSKAHLFEWTEIELEVERLVRWHVTSIGAMLEPRNLLTQGKISEKTVRSGSKIRKSAKVD